MKTNLLIRDLKKSDLTAVKQIIDDNQMFPSEYLDEMTSGYFAQTSVECWYVAETSEGDVVSLTYCAPERMTEGTWNLLLIAVASPLQGQGIGGLMMTHVEDELTRRQVRVLLVETSGLPDYQLTRRFYPKCGYSQVARIPEFYAAGDDKVVFWKSLQG